jgi:hypothetical protein
MPQRDGLWYGWATFGSRLWIVTGGAAGPHPESDVLDRLAKMILLIGPKKTRVSGCSLAANIR